MDANRIMDTIIEAASMQKATSIEKTVEKDKAGTSTEKIVEEF